MKFIFLLAKRKFQEIKCFMQIVQKEIGSNLPKKAKNSSSGIKETRRKKKIFRMPHGCHLGSLLFIPYINDF